MAEEVEKIAAEKSSNKLKGNKKDKVRPLTKVVIRRLPPSMTEEEFLKQTDPLPDHEYFYFVPADWSLGQDATCRAYINFTNPDDIFLFKDRFDGYVFVDSKGAEYPAIVEFAPFQGLPRNKSRKKDPKCGTIESDPHYLNFLEALKNEENEGNKAEVKLEFSYQIKDDKKITSTPLLQFLASKKQERRDERRRKLEEKRRQREEERQRRKALLTKNIPAAIVEEESKKEQFSENRKDKEDEVPRKESRSKRRTERDFRRRQDRENKNVAEKKAEDQMLEKLHTQKLVEDEEGEDKKKEVKKYSKNRRVKNESQKSDVNFNAESDHKNLEDQGQSEKVENNSNESKEDREEISESVKEFIKSVANIKEFVPRNRTIMSNTDIETSIKTQKETEVDVSKITDKLRKIVIAEKEDKENEEEFSHSFSRTDNSPENDARDSSCSGNDRNEKSSHSRSVRRIRNKDRPSIEIYQPGKLRLKREDGRSSAELRDNKSNPTSEGETVKKDKDEKVSVKKKVTRYSERRSNRVKEKLSATEQSDSVQLFEKPQDN